MRHQIWLLVCVLLCTGVYSTETEGEKKETEIANLLSLFDVGFKDDIRVATTNNNDDAAIVPGVVFPPGELTGLSNEDGTPFTVDIPAGELIKPTAGPYTPPTEKKGWLPSLYESVRGLPVTVVLSSFWLDAHPGAVPYEWRGMLNEALDGPMKESREVAKHVESSAIDQLCKEDGRIHIPGENWSPLTGPTLEMKLDTGREQEKHNEIFKHCRLVSWVLRESLHDKWHITYQDMRHSLFEVGVFDIDSDDHEWLQKEDDSWWITPHGKGGDPILFYDMQFSPEFQQYQITRKKLREAMEELSKQIREMEQEGASAAPQPLVSNIKELVQNTDHYSKLAQELMIKE